MQKPYLHMAMMGEMGRGVFTSKKIAANTIIEVAPVIVMSGEDRLLLDKTLLYNYIFEWGEEKDRCAMALGLVAMYNHSYQSNCEYFMDFEEDTILVKTVRDIKKGEELTINYNGDWDNKAKVGFDFKANVAGKFQFYGQFLLDEFVLSKLKNDPSNYVNKYAYQLGAKYIDAFGIHNLDLQVESNRIRPFTYSHYDSVSNYTHYNQPMAHPLGANLQEFVGILKYQPAAKWYVYGRAIYYYQGLDSAGYNFGGNPQRLYNTGKPLLNPADPLSPQRLNGFKVGSGMKATCLNVLLQLSYEVRENLYFDLSLQHRTYKVPLQNTNTSNTLFTAGIRWNIAKRVYDF